MSNFVVVLLQYVGLYDENVIREVSRVLKQGAGLSGIEKRKGQIDYLVKKGRYGLALKNYEVLLKKWEEEAGQGEVMPAVSCLASIHHNRGVAYAGLMDYKRAAECFLTAWQLQAEREYAVAYLAAKRLTFSPQEYVDFVAQHSEWAECALELEKVMDDCVQEWEQQPDYLMLYRMMELKSEAQLQMYYEESGRIVRALKDKYRNSTAEG